MRRIVALFALLALPAFAESPYRDLRRPVAKKPYDGLVIEWISQTPKVRVARDGDSSAPLPGKQLGYTAHLRNLGTANTEPVMVRWFVDGVQAKTGTIAGVGAGQRATADFGWEALE